MYSTVVMLLASSLLPRLHAAQLAKPPAAIQFTDDLELVLNSALVWTLIIRDVGVAGRLHAWSLSVLPSPARTVPTGLMSCLPCPDRRPRSGAPLPRFPERI